MTTSLPVMVLVSLVAAATIYAFYLDVRRGSELGRFVKWLKSERKAEWGALTRSDRFLTIRAIEILRRGALADDPEFQNRYRSTRHSTRFLAAMGVGVAGIAVLILGTQLFDWNW